MLMNRTAVLMVVVAFAAPARAAEDVLTLLPEKTIGFVVVNKMSDVSDKLGKYARELDLPLPDLLALAKASVGIGPGLDTEGTLLLAAVSSIDGSEKIQDSEGLVAVQVSDYKQFVEQLNGDASVEITDLSLGGRLMLAANKSGYAVLVQSDSEHRSLLKQVLEQDAKVPAEIAVLGEWIAENDAAVVVLPPGIKQLAEQGIITLEKAKEQFSQMEQLGDQADQITAAFDMYLQMLRVVTVEVQAAAKGLRIDDAGNIHLGGRVRFTESGQLAKISGTSNRSTKELLTGLPGGTFVGAVGGSLSPEGSELIAKWSVTMMKDNPALYGMKLSGEAADEYLDLTRTSMKGIQGFSMMLVPGAAGAPILNGMLGMISTEDALEFLAKYDEAMGRFQELIKKSGSKFPYAMEATKTEIGGLKGQKVTVDIRAALVAQGGPPEVAQMMEQMFGENGTVTVHLLAVQKDKLLFSYGSAQTIERQIAAIKDGKPGLAEETSIVKTAALLPRDVSLVAYLSPRGAVAWFKNIVPRFLLPNAVAKIPDFPDTPAVGFSAKMVAGGLETELVVPAELPKAVKEYVERVQQ